MPHSTTTPTTDLQFQVADRRKRGYYTVDNVLLDVYGAQLGPYAIAVYNALARCANADDKCWPGHAAIARLTGMSTKQVGREIDKLAGLGIVAVTPRYDPETKTHSSNLYTLLNIVGTMDTQSVGTHRGEITQSRATGRKSYKQSLRKKDLDKKPAEDDAARRLSYLPPEYRDVMIG